MKKISFFFLLLPAFLLVLSGCSQKSTSRGSSELKATNKSNTPRNGIMRQPDFGQPDRAADVRGVIKSIIGNEITVLKIDQSGRDQKASSTLDNNSQENGTNTKSSVNLSLNNSAGMPGRIPGGGVGSREGGGMPGDPMGQDSDTRAQMLEKLKEMSTGEEKVVIPVGIKMLKSAATTQNEKREMVEATLSDLTTDKMITIWLNSAITDKKIAEFVLIN